MSMIINVILSPRRGDRIQELLPSVSLRVLLLPVPGIAAHFFDAVLSFPAEFVECFLRVAIASGDVACAARLDAVRDFYVVYIFECVDNVKHGIAVARTEVVNGESAFAFDGLECGNVACGEVANVDVVANSCAIGGVIVVAEHAEFLAEANGSLRDVWH